MTGTEQRYRPLVAYGLGDMLEKANLYAQLIFVLTNRTLRFAASSHWRCLPLNEKGERVWPKAQDDASFVLVDASCSAEAVARICREPATFHKGQLVWGSVAG